MSLTGKTPSELAAEVAVLTAQIAEVREQRDYYRGVPAGAEVARLERAGAAAFEAMRKSQAEVARLNEKVDALTVEVEEESHIQARMAQLLAGAIVAIRGPEPELTRWGYHDLPERVREIVAQRDALLERAGAAAFEALRKERARVEQLEAALAHWQPIPLPPQKQMQESQAEVARLKTQRDALLAAAKCIVERFGPVQSSLIFSKRQAIDKTRAAIHQCEGAKA